MARRITRAQSNAEDPDVVIIPPPTTPRQTRASSRKVRQQPTGKPEEVERVEGVEETEEPKEPETVTKPKKRAPRSKANDGETAEKTPSKRKGKRSEKPAVVEPVSGEEPSYEVSESTKLSEIVPQEEFHEAQAEISENLQERRRSTISGVAVPELYSDLRKSEEDIVQLKMDELQRQHDIEKAKLGAKIDALEEQLKMNTKLLTMEKDNRESQVRALKGLLKQTTAEADILRAKEKNYANLEKEFENYRELHTSNSEKSSEEATKAQVETDNWKHAQEKRELEEAHSKEIQSVRAEYEEQVKDTEQRMRHRMEEEINKLMIESQQELEKLAKVKDEELEIFKTNQERKRRRTSQFVSPAEHEQLKIKLELLTKELEKEAQEPPLLLQRKDVVIAERLSPVKPKTSGTSGDTRQLRAEVAELKSEMIKKANAVEKTQLELTKLRNQMQSSKSVSETKIVLLKSKIKSLEGQLAKKKPASGSGGVSTPNGQAPITPVAGGSGPGTRFNRVTETKNNKTVAGPLRFSTFSTTPYLARTGAAAQKTTIGEQSTGSPRVTTASPRKSVLGQISSQPSHIPSPIPRQSSPLRRTIAVPMSQQRKGVIGLSPIRRMMPAHANGNDSTGQAVSTKKDNQAGFMAMSKLTGKKISLFDDDEEEDDAALEQEEIQKEKVSGMPKRGQTSESSTTLNGNPNTKISINEDEPKRRRGKRKLNSVATVDIYEKGDNEDDDHPDVPGSVFKRVKLSASPRSHHQMAAVIGTAPTPTASSHRNNSYGEINSSIKKAGKLGLGTKSEGSVVQENVLLGAGAGGEGTGTDINNRGGNSVLQTSAANRMSTDIKKISSQTPTGGKKTKDNSGNTTMTSMSTSSPRPISSNPFGHNISPLKARNKRIREIFKV